MSSFSQAYSNVTMSIEHMPYFPAQNEVRIACGSNSQLTTRTVDVEYKDLFVFKLT